MAKAKTPATPNTTEADEPILSGEYDSTGASAHSGSESFRANGPDPVIGLRISAAREGFRRAGRAWSRQPTDVPLADLSDDQVAMLRAESLLTVEEIVLEESALP